MNKSRLLLLLLDVGMIANSIAAPPQVTLTVTVQGEGTVTSVPAGIDCREGTAGCSENFKKSSTVTLMAEADPDSTFLGWTDSDACGGTDPECVTKVTNPTFVTAIFDTAVVSPIAPVLQTGQTLCWDAAYDQTSCAGTGQDGEYQAGTPQPTPRFVSNDDGTVTDIVTGLTWLQRPECLNQLTWIEALAAANNLANGQCNLTDGSLPGDWRLPNFRELQSLSSSDAETKPIGSDITQSPFIYVFGDSCGTSRYWSSTSQSPGNAWELNVKLLRQTPKDYLGCAFAVKGGL